MRSPEDTQQTLMLSGQRGCGKTGGGSWTGKVGRTEKSGGDGIKNTSTTGEDIYTLKARGEIKTDASCGREGSG